MTNGYGVGMLLTVLMLGASPLLAESERSQQVVDEQDLREKQLRFDLKQLELMNVRQQRMIKSMHLRLEQYKSQVGNSETLTDSGDIASEKRDEKDSQSSLDNLLQEQHAVFSRRWVIEPGITYSGSDRKQISLNGFLAVDAIFLGRLDVDEVDNRVITVDVSTRYTLSDAVQLYLKVPYVYRRAEYASAGVEFSSASASEAKLDDKALGDISFGAFFRLATETATTPDVVVNLGARAPTGTDPFGIKVVSPDPNNTNLRVPGELPTGSGVWAGTLGLSMVKTFDPAIVFGGIEYTYQFDERFDDISTAPGNETPGEVQLGSSLQLNLGTAFALNELMSLNFSFTNQLLNDSRIKSGSGSWVSIPGSSANIATFNIGSTFNISKQRSLSVTLATGLTREASDFGLNFRMPFVI